MVKEKNQIVIAIEFLANIVKNTHITVSGKYGISPIQLQILIYMKSHNASATLTELVKEFGLSKATLSDSIRILEEKSFIKKKKNPEDARSSILMINKRNQTLPDLFSEDDKLDRVISALGKEKQEKILPELLDLLSALESQSIISERRMCLNCQYYRICNDTSFYCSFLKKNFNNYHLKSDCEDFKSGKGK